MHPLGTIFASGPRQKKILVLILRKQTKKKQEMGMLKEFKEFAIKGNVIDLAVGVIIGGAFGKIVDSVVADLIIALFEGLTGLAVGVVLWGLHMGMTQGLLAALVADAAPAGS